MDFSLNKEVKAFQDYLHPTKAETDAVETCVQQISNFIAQILPDARVSLHGPREIGLADPLSEIVLGVQILETQGNDNRTTKSAAASGQKYAAGRLRHLQSSLMKHDRYSDIELIHKPNREGIWLRTLDKPTGLTVKIIQKPSPLAEEMSKYYMQEFPQLGPLHSILYQALRFRGLHTLSRGGLDPYCLLILMLTALSHSESYVQKDHLGENLLHFLNFWVGADLRQHGYSVEPPYRFSKYSRTFARGGMESEEPQNSLALEGMKRLVQNNLMHLKSGPRPYKLCLQDPAYPYKDLGNPVSRISDIQNFFSTVLNSVNHGSERWDCLTSQERRREGTSAWLLRDLLVGDCKGFFAARDKVRRASPTWI